MININYKKLGNIFINTLQGELSIKTVDDFNGIIQIQFKLNPEVIAINCENLNYLDSTGINHLFKLSKKASTMDIEIIYLNLSADVNNIFNMTYLNKICKVTSLENFEADYLV